jgi:hypothetical protein
MNSGHNRSAASDRGADGDFMKDSAVMRGYRAGAAIGPACFVCILRTIPSRDFEEMIPCFRSCSLNPGPRLFSVPSADAPCSCSKNCRGKCSPALLDPSGLREAVPTGDSKMKTAASSKLPKRAQGPRAMVCLDALKTDRAVGQRLSQYPHPRSNSQATAKNGSPSCHSARPIPILRASFTPPLRYQPQMAKPGLFNPELCGGLRPSQTLAC